MRKSGNWRIAFSFTVLGLLIAANFIGLSPQFAKLHASADSALVQHISGANTACIENDPCALSLTLPSDVTSGDVLVVLAFDSSGSGGSFQFLSVSDSFGSYTEQGHNTYTAIFTATLSSSGSDTVTVSDDSSGPQLGAEVFEVSGVTTTLAQTATGSGFCSSTPCAISTSSSVSFIPGAFLASVITIDNPETFTSSTGFSTDTIISGQLLDTYSTSGVSSPTSFQGTLSAGPAVDWTTLGIALEPLSTVTTVTSSTTVTSVSASTVTQTNTETQTVTSTSISRTTQTVTAAAVHVECSPNSLTLGHFTLCNATAIAGLSPAGTIVFSNSLGTGIFGKENCVNSGENTLTCSISYKPSTTGTQYVIATYENDPNYLTATASDSIHAKPHSAQAMITVSAPAATGGLLETITAALSSFLQIAALPALLLLSAAGYLFAMRKRVPGMSPSYDE